MEIGFDAKRIFHNKSGLGAYSRSLVRHLATQFPEHNFHLYTPSYIGRESISFFEKQKNISIHKIPRPNWFWRTVFLPFYTRRDRLDVYHGLSGEIPLLRFAPNVKKVLTIHDVIFKSHPHFYGFWDRLLYSMKTKWSLSKADEIIAISKHTRTQLLKHFSSEYDIRVVPPLLNDLYLSNPSRHLKSSEFKTLYNLRNGYFLYVGSITGRKNVAVLLSAFSKMPKEKKKKLVFITNDDDQELRRLAKKYELDDWIRVERHVDDKTLSLYYSFCSAVVYTSQEEGFGLPILEGIAHGAKVICSDHPAHREAGGELPEYFEPNNFEELSRLLSSLSYHERKSDIAALSHLNTFNPSLICGELMGIYAEK